MRSFPRPAALAALLLAARPVSAQIYSSSFTSHEVYAHHAGTGAQIGPAAFITAGSGGLSVPHGILDRGAELLVASFGNDSIKRYRQSDGAYLGDFLTGTNGLSQPVQLRLGPDGLLYVSSQGNDRILRFHVVTGAPADPAPFIQGGALDGPSGFDWSPDGSVLYVSGRYSTNVLAYDAVTGAPRATNHVFATGSGSGSTFGLVVDRSSGDVFVATGGQVRRYTPAGLLVTNVALSAIGLESAPDRRAIVAASSGNLRRISLADASVGAPLLSGTPIAILNFFALPPAPLPVEQVVVTTNSQPHAALRFTVDKGNTNLVTTVQVSDDLLTWTDAGSYTATGLDVVRNASTNTVPHTRRDNGGTVTVTERDVVPLGTVPRRFFRVRPVTP